MELSRPRNKDQQRVYDIVRKSMPGGMRRNAVADPARANRTFMILEASRMNKKITDELKRTRRHEAALQYHLPEIADCFVHPHILYQRKLARSLAIRSEVREEKPVYKPVNEPPPAPKIVINH